MESTIIPFTEEEKAESLAKLLEYARSIAQESTPLSELENTILHYSIFLRNILSKICPEFIDQRDVNDPTTLDSGAAISPWHAAACLEDRVRTTAFIRGAILAIKHELKQTKERPLHLIEAGCGPMGALVLPLLAYFDEDELEVSVIDLHQESTIPIEHMFNHFGFAKRVKHVIQGDATSTSIKSPAHLVLTETMNFSLHQEPQVAISQKLMKDHPNATLIPESIKVDLALIDLHEEFSHFPPRQGERTVLGNVFELNKTTARDLIPNNGLLPAGTIQLPDEIKANQLPSFTTSIQVFQDVAISNYQSQITIPEQLRATTTPGETLQFVYQLGDSPGIRLLR